MIKWIIRHFGLRGSFLWACRQMKKGRIVKLKYTTGAVKLRFDTEGQGRIQWAFVHELKNAEWENAYVFYKDILSTNWEVWTPPKSEE